MSALAASGSADGSQSVLVSAVNSFRTLGIAASIAVAGTAGVGASVAVRVVELHADASIAANAVVNARNNIEVRADAPLEQLRQVVAELRLPAPAALFTRCLLCNVELVPATEAERRAELPPDAQLLPGPVHRCPRCGRIYWMGSHARRMRAALERALPAWLPPALVVLM